MSSRIKVYNEYREIYNLEDVDKPNLLKQQRFLSSYVIRNYDIIDKMLLFHGIGTGKTCTSISIAEAIMDKYIEMKTLVILPARLISNFKDELISSTCGLRDKYLTKEEYDLLFNPTTSKKIKKAIDMELDRKINERYNIISFENLTRKIKKSTDIIKTISELTNNKIIIIDEVHNLITSKIKPETLEKVIKAKMILKETPSLNGIIMRLLTKFAHPTSKIFLLTATPIYDNYGQFIELILNLCPKINDKDIVRNFTAIKKLVPHLRGKISYYKLDDKSFFPSVKTENLLLPLTITQENAIKLIQPDKEVKDDEDNEEIKDSFCLKERQLSISTIKKSHITLSGLEEYAPKISNLLELLKLNGKHLIYCNFIENGLDIIAKILEMNGWTNYLKNKQEYKSFIIWDANLKHNQKSFIKEILNNVDNMDGKHIRIILGSPSIKEGISFKHIQHLHQIDPVWNSSGKEQIEGRCIRYKSHEDIPLSHPELKREVIIHNYISIARKDGEIKETCDVKIYNLIIDKFKIVKKIEEILKLISIDYYLPREKKPSKSSSLSLSPIIEELYGMSDKRIVSKPDKKEKNTCPIDRRPNEEGKCLLDGYTIIRKNKQGYDCCYKNEASSKPKEEVVVVKRITRSATSRAKEGVEKGGRVIRKKQIKKYI
jgi:hypothetical protein